MMHDVPAIAIENRDQVEERPASIDVGNVDMPVRMGFQRMLESVSFLRCLVAFSIQSACGLEHAVDRRRSDCHDIIIEHHERQSTVAFEGVLVVKIDDRLLLPVFQPPFPGNFAVVGIYLAVTSLPVVALAGGQLDPSQELTDSDLSSFVPVLGVVDDLVTRIMGHPATFQSPPLSFFERMFSSINSEITSFLAMSFSRSSVTVRSIFILPALVERGVSKARSAWLMTALTQLWINVGLTCIWSAIWETGTLSTRCFRTAAALSAAEKERRFRVIVKSPQVKIAHHWQISNFKRGSTVAIAKHGSPNTTPWESTPTKSKASSQNLRETPRSNIKVALSSYSCSSLKDDCDRRS